MDGIETTLVLSEDALCSARSLAARTGKSLDSIADAALREYADARLLEGLMSTGDMASDEALALAVQEVRAFRSR